MLTITNTHILIDRDFITDYSVYVKSILDYLTYTDPVTKEVALMYTVASDLIKIPIGYLSYLKIDLTSPDVKDLRRSGIKSVEFNRENWLKVADILPAIMLREDQTEAVLTALRTKSGIYQMATGSGKTEVICAIIKYWQEEMNITPNILILEPTVQLVNQTIARLAKYGIDATNYIDTREVGGIKVTHPASIYNDLVEDPLRLSQIQVIICDEGHHLSAITWRTILDGAMNLEVRLAFSASIIRQENIKFTELTSLDLEELLIVGVMGGVAIHHPPSYYIQLDILAKPYVFRMFNKADEKIVSKTKGRTQARFHGVDYHAIKNDRLGSAARFALCAATVVELCLFNLKTLILVDTKEQATTLLKIFDSMGWGSRARSIFGGQTVMYFNPTTDQPEVVDEDAIQSLTDGRINILIGTSVMYEGADLPLLDVVVLYSVGIEQRVFIQTIGRVLRKGKTGKFAYIVDFTDHECNVLRKQSHIRKHMYLDIIGVDDSDIYDGIAPQMIGSTYLLIEEKGKQHGT
jgi:superfamily II DNA or RNA helicase